MLLKVLSKLSFDGKTALTVEGNCNELKNGDTVKDEKGNIFTVVSVGMTHYETPELWSRITQLLISGNGFSGELLHIGR